MISGVASVYVKFIEAESTRIVPIASWVYSVAAEILNLASSAACKSVWSESVPVSCPQTAPLTFNSTLAKVVKPVFCMACVAEEVVKLVRLVIISNSSLSSSMPVSPMYPIILFPPNYLILILLL